MAFSVKLPRKTMIIFMEKLFLNPWHCSCPKSQVLRTSNKEQDCLSFLSPLGELFSVTWFNLYTFFYIAFLSCTQNLNSCITDCSPLSILLIHLYLKSSFFFHATLYMIAYHFQKTSHFWKSIWLSNSFLMPLVYGFKIINMGSHILFFLPFFSHRLFHTQLQ